MEKQPTTSALVRFQDCDPLGHLNNSKYLDYMINAREDHLRNFYDLDIYDYLDRNKIGWVVGKNEIVYRNPALMNEEVSIRSQVMDFDDRRISVEIAMFDKNHKHLKALLWTDFIPFDIMINSVSKHTEEITSLLQNVQIDIEEKTIEERLEAIKIGLKDSDD